MGGTRRGGRHRRVGGERLGCRARETVRREDTRRRPNGVVHALAAGVALGHTVSRTWKGLPAARCGD